MKIESSIDVDSVRNEYISGATSTRQAAVRWGVSVFTIRAILFGYGKWSASPPSGEQLKLIRARMGANKQNSSAARKGHCAIPEAQVNEIRDLYFNGTHTYASLADRFAVSCNTIRYVVAALGTYARYPLTPEQLVLFKKSDKRLKGLQHA